MSTAEHYLKQAAAEMAERAASRDQPGGERSMARTVAAFNAIYGAGLTEVQGWQFMALLKIVRGSQGEYREDDFTDQVAYSALAAEAGKPPLMTRENAESAHTCWLPLNPNVKASELPLDVIEETPEGMICVPCDADGWIEWPGGTIPLPESTMVEVETMGAGRTRPIWAHSLVWNGLSDVVVARFRLAGLEGGSGVADGGGYGFVGGI